MEENYCIYKHTAPNGKCYIGLTKHGDNPNVRWQNGDKYQECPHFYAAIQKYGWDSFSHEILEDGLSRDTASCRERYWISHYDSYKPENGYNLTTGGETGWEHSEDTKERIRQKHIGTKTSDETKEKLRKIALSRPPMSSDQRAKISAGTLGHTITESDRQRRMQKRTTYHVTDETRKKLSDAARKGRTRCRRVICEETGEIFNSAREASIHYGKAKNSLTSCIFQNRRFCGMHWKYLDDMGEYRMSISDKNVRAGLVIPKDLKAKLEELAKSENRSLNNYIVTILQNYVNSLPDTRQ